MSNGRNPNGPGLKLKDVVYLSGFDNASVSSEEMQEYLAAGSPELGYYSSFSMQDAVNDFSMMYTGKGRMFRLQW